MIKTNLKKALTYYGILSLIPLIIIIIGIRFITDIDAIVYCLLNFYIIMPLTALFSGMIFARNKIGPFWLNPVVFAVYMLIIPLLVFHYVDIPFTLITIIPSIIGVIIGLALKKAFSK